MNTKQKCCLSAMMFLLAALTFFLPLVVINAFGVELSYSSQSILKQAHTLIDAKAIELNRINLIYLPYIIAIIAAIIIFLVKGRIGKIFSIIAGICNIVIFGGFVLKAESALKNSFGEYLSSGISLWSILGIGFWAFIVLNLIGVIFAALAIDKVERKKISNKQTMVLCFIIPCLLTLLIMYLYPVVRTVIMSFFQIESVTSDTSTWVFNGMSNYQKIFNSPGWQASMWNMFRIWLVGGIIVLSFSLLFAVILTSGIRFKKFFRAAIYLPNVISAVALATMWIQYVYNNDYGMLNKILRTFGLEGVKWLGNDTKFWAMLFAFIFGAVGYYMLIFISGIERIPADLYEAATIDGANKVQQFGKITMPLLKGITKTNITFWSVHTTTFFLWSKMFSPVDSEITTTVPVVYLYDTVFGGKGNSTRDAGAGAATGVILALIIVVIYVVMNRLLRDDDLEF